MKIRFLTTEVTMRKRTSFAFGILIGLVSTTIAFGGGGWSCLTAGTTTPCPVGSTCTYLFMDNCTTGDGFGNSTGSYHSCSGWGWGCGDRAKCDGYAGGSSCYCLINDSCK